MNLPLEFSNISVGAGDEIWRAAADTQRRVALVLVCIRTAAVDVGVCGVGVETQGIRSDTDDWACFFMSRRKTCADTTRAQTV